MSKIAVPAIGILIAASGCSWFSRGPNNSPEKGLDREYAAPPDKAWDAARNAGTVLGLRLTKAFRDGLGGEMSYRRADDSEVVIRVVPLLPDHSRIFVWVHPGDLDLAYAVHDKISAGLGANGGETLECMVPRDIQFCFGEVTRACRANGMTITFEEMKGKRARVEARTADRQSVRVDLEACGPSGTKMRFMCGSDRGEKQAAQLRKLKETFDRGTGE